MDALCEKVIECPLFGDYHCIQSSGKFEYVHISILTLEPLEEFLFLILYF